MFQPVAHCVFPGQGHGGFGNIHRCDMFGAAQRCVEGKRTGVGEAVQHGFAPCQTRHRPAVVFLVKEKAGFLAVFKIHSVAHAVFHNLGDRFRRRRFTRQGEPALSFGKSFFFPQARVVAFVHAANGLPVGAQKIHQGGQQHVLALLHAEGQNLNHQNIVEAVHGQAGESVRLAEDYAAAGEILRRQDAFAIIPGILQPPAPESFIESVVGVAGNQAAADFAVAVVKGAAQPAAFGAEYICDGAVGDRPALGGDLCVVNPGVAAQQSAFALGRNGDCGVGPLCFHGVSSAVFQKVTTV